MSGPLAYGDVPKNESVGPGIDCPIAVIGVPDDEAGELPKAFVVPRPGETITLEEIQALVKEHLVSYKQIRLLQIVDVIPKSASGKILRRELRTL